MANELIKQNYRNIADAIRAKTGENGTMTAEEMPGKIEASLAKKPVGSLSITENGTGIDVSEKATVDVNVPNPSTGTYEITENGTYDITDYAEVDVDVASTPTYESYYMYITDGSGNLLTDEGEYAGSNDVFWRDGSNLEYTYLSTGELYKFDGTSGNNAFTHIQLDSSSNLYYYTGDSCSPLSGVNVESDHLYRYAGHGDFNDFGEVTSDWNIVLCHTGGSDTVLMTGFKDLAEGESTEVIMYTSYGDEYRLLITRQPNSN